MKEPTKKKADFRGRPTLSGAPLISRSLGLPEEAWKRFDEEAYRLRISTNELLRRKLGLKASP